MVIPSLPSLPALNEILQSHSQVGVAIELRSRFLTSPRAHIGYSVVTYLLQIKDRHNGNILIDREGHLVHIDFGFMLANSPGNIGFEAAPFKLPLEYIEVLGGIDGKPYWEFRRLFKEGFKAARKHCDRIISTLATFLVLYRFSPIPVLSPRRTHAKRYILTSTVSWLAQ